MTYTFGLLNIPQSPDNQPVSELEAQLQISTNGLLGRSASSLSAAGQSPMSALREVDLDSGRWVNYWPPGCSRVVIANIPPGVTDDSLIELLRSAVKSMNPAIENGILKITRIIGEKAPTQELSIVGIALVDCASEIVAQLLWCASDDCPPVFGRRLNISPDPTGFRAFGHAVALNARPSDFESLADACSCCKKFPEQSMPQEKSRLILPFMTPATIAEKLADINGEVEWNEKTGCCVICFDSSEIRQRFCLPLVYSFSHFMDPPLSAGWFTYRGLVAPAIIDPAKEGI